MKPQVKIIQQQEEINNNPNIDSYEAEQLLRKYSPEQTFSTRIEEIPINNGLTFEEMVKQQQAKENSEKVKLEQQKHLPKPKTFDGQGGYDSQIKYESEDGISFKIEITTDMKIPKY